MYGQRKLLASRIPLQYGSPSRKPSNGSTSHQRSISETSDVADGLSTPAVTEGETATDTELETETEADHPRVLDMKERTDTPDTMPGTPSENYGTLRLKTSLILTQHDLMNRFFRKDAIILHNLDLLRYVETYRSELSSPLTLYSLSERRISHTCY